MIARVRMSANKYAIHNRHDQNSEIFLRYSRILYNGELCCPKILLHTLTQTRPKFVRFGWLVARNVLTPSSPLTWRHVFLSWSQSVFDIPLGPTVTVTFSPSRRSPETTLLGRHSCLETGSIHYFTAPVLKLRYADGLLFLSNYRCSLILSRAVTHKCRVLGQPLASPENSATSTPSGLCWTFCLGAGRGFVRRDPEKRNHTSLETIQFWFTAGKNLIVAVAMETLAVYILLL